MSTRNGFDPNQKRASDGTWEKQRGSRPPTGSLSTSRNDEATPGEEFYAQQQIRDQAFDRSTWENPEEIGMPTAQITIAQEANDRMRELAPTRIRELLLEEHPDAVAAMFTDQGGRWAFTGYTTELTRRPQPHQAAAEVSEEVGDLIDAMPNEHTKWEARDMDGLRIDRANNWYLPLRPTEDDETLPGWARDSDEGVTFENASLELEASRLIRLAEKIDRPRVPVRFVTDQAELMWFVENGTQDQVNAVARSEHAGPAVLHNIAAYRNVDAGGWALMNNHVSTSTIRRAWARTPKNTVGGTLSFSMSKKTPPDIAEAVGREDRISSGFADPAPRIEPYPLRDPDHWSRYTPAQRDRLRQAKPINFDELSSSAKDLWEERTLRQQ